MKLSKAYTTGLKETLKMPRLLFLLFATNIVMAWIAASVFKKMLASQLANSMNFSLLSKGFDLPTIMDWIKEYPGQIPTLIFVVMITGLIYLVINVFLVGGILRVLNKDTFTMSHFLSGGSYNFRKFLQISALMLVVQILLGVVIYMIIPLANMLFDIQTEVGTFRAFFVAAGIHVFVFVFMLIISDYAKFYALLHDTFNPFRAIWESAKFSFKYFLRTNILYWMVLLTSILVLYLFYSLHNDIHELKTVGIILVFVLQQLIIFLRIFFRVWTFSSQFELYSETYLADERARIDKMRLLEWDERAKEKAQQQIPNDEDLPEIHEIADAVLQGNPADELMDNDMNEMDEYDGANEIIDEGNVEAEMPENTEKEIIDSNSLFQPLSEEELEDEDLELDNENDEPKG